ncbi:MAG TPA: hypothetical protein VGS02_00115 [Acidobacteriaceae bacterium]|nr:hypothetical protein [Acidobacteriaceae bacterium]
MANKTFIEKAAEKVGYSLAMAEDVAGTVKTTIGSLAESLKKSPPVQEATTAMKPTAESRPTNQSAEKSAAKKSAARKSAEKKSAAKKSAAKKSVPKEAAKKAPKRRRISR